MIGFRHLDPHYIIASYTIRKPYICDRLHSPAADSFHVDLLRPHPQLELTVPHTRGPTLPTHYSLKTQRQCWFPALKSPVCCNCKPRLPIDHIPNPCNLVTVHRQLPQTPTLPLLKVVCPKLHQYHAAAAADASTATLTCSNMEPASIIAVTVRKWLAILPTKGSTSDSLNITATQNFSKKTTRRQ
jgi:hypothetical protein